MSPTSISGGGNLLTGGELISPASLKGQEEVLPSAKLEQWPYKKRESAKNRTPIFRLCLQMIFFNLTIVFTASFVIGDANEQDLPFVCL